MLRAVEGALPGLLGHGGHLQAQQRGGRWSGRGWHTAVPALVGTVGPEPEAAPAWVPSPGWWLDGPVFTGACACPRPPPGYT